MFLLTGLTPVSLVLLAGRRGGRTLHCTLYIGLLEILVINQGNG
jgi:hypothetical protein